MTHRLGVLVVVFALSAAPVRARSQITFDGCADAFGRPVASVMDPSISDVAMARMTPLGPAIFYNPGVLHFLQPPTRLFFYAHECAHHALGHTLGRVPVNLEQEADCWAIRTLVAFGAFGPWQIAAVQQDIARFGRSDWLHVPGPQRAINLRACLQ